MPYDKEYITRYLDNELAPGEKGLFEAEMLRDHSLAAEVSLYKEVLATLKSRLPEDKSLKDLRGHLHKVGAVYFQPEKSKVVPVGKYLAKLAIAAAAIVFIVMLWPSGNYMDKYGDIQMITSTERGEGQDSVLQQAAVHFNKKEFEQALPLLDVAVKRDSSDQMALFYRGVARQFTGQMGAGSKDLEKVFNGESVFKYEAAYYIGLGFAGEKNKEKAAEWLNKIPAGSDISEKAEKLLEKL